MPILVWDMCQQMTTWDSPASPGSALSRMVHSVSLCVGKEASCQVTSTLATLQAHLFLALSPPHTLGSRGPASLPRTCGLSRGYTGPWAPEGLVPRFTPLPSQRD